MTSLGVESQFFTHMMKVVAATGCLFQNVSAVPGLLN